MDDKKNKSDEEIIMHIIAGNRNEYRFIVSRYEDKLTRYVRSIVGKSHDIDDIVQTVFIKAYTNIRSFDSTLKFSSWIYRIAHNESVNHVKSSVISKLQVFGEWFDFGKPDDTEQELDREIMKKQLDSCLQTLDMKYREPLLLYYYEDKSYEEISDILRLPVRAVGVRIYRAKEIIRRLCYGKITR